MLLASHIAAALFAIACPPGDANEIATPANTSQLVTVEAPVTATTHATLRIWRRAGGCWRAAGGPWAARVGRNGLSANRREGDGTTPIGSFGFASTIYGVAPDPGVRFRYHRLVCGDWWNEDVSSPSYNSFQHVACGRRPPFSTKSEGMWQQPTAYAHVAVIDFNMQPVVPGRGSGIFLHAQTGRATNGCISLPRAALVRVLRWLRPDAHPRIVIGTTS